MAEYVRSMDGGDGGRYADTTNIGKIISKTTSFTIPPNIGVANYSNRGSGASVTFTLPPPRQGTIIRIFRLSSLQTVVIQRSGTASIFGPVTPFNGTTVTASTGSERGSCDLIADGIDWMLRPFGTWTIS